MTVTRCESRPLRRRFRHLHYVGDASGVSTHIRTLRPGPDPAPHRSREHAVPLTPKCRSPWRRNSVDKGVMATGPGNSCGILRYQPRSGTPLAPSAPPHSHDIEGLGSAIGQRMRYSNGRADVRRTVAVSAHHELGRFLLAHGNKRKARVRYHPPGPKSHAPCQIQNLAFQAVLPLRPYDLSGQHRLHMMRWLAEEATSTWSDLAGRGRAWRAGKPGLSASGS